MQLGSSLSAIVQPAQAEKRNRDTFEGERTVPRMSPTLRYGTPSTQTPLAPPSPWQQFKPFGRKTQSAPNSPYLGEEEDEVQQVRRPKGKRRVSDPGARSRSYEPKEYGNKRSPLVGWTAYFTGSPRASPRMDTMSHSPLLHTVEEDEDEEETSQIVETADPVDALGISLFNTSISAPQSTVEVAPTPRSPPPSSRPPMPKRMSFSPSPYRFVTTPDLMSGSNSPASYRSSPRTPRDSPYASSSKTRQSPSFSDVNMMSPQIKRTTSYTDVFSNIMTPGSTTIYNAESPVIASPSSVYDDGFESVEVEMSVVSKLPKPKYESVSIPPIRNMVPTPRFTEQERAVRQWSSQNKQSAWPVVRNNAVLTV